MAWVDDLWSTMKRRFEKRMPNPFEKILTQAAVEGIFPIFDAKAREWFRKKAQATAVSGPSLIKQIPTTVSGKPGQGTITSDPSKLQIGDCLIFEYQAKWAERLPYWDRFPAIFLVDVWPDGKILGINLHYLPYQLRAKLMDALYSVITGLPDNTRLALSYKVLKSATKFRSFWPALKQYHTSHIKTRIIKVMPNEWDVGLFLPIARWEKKSEGYVWKKSEGIIEKYSAKYGGRKPRQK